MYLIRLDDASEFMDIDKWTTMEILLDNYRIKPIVGVIPDNNDGDFTGKYEKNPRFWEMVRTWEQKKWTIALHGYTHVLESNSEGMNPVNSCSEFAGLPLGDQRYKIREGIRIMKQHEITPKVFFAPAHTFDKNTLEALKLESEISVICDTVANDIYYRDGFHFIPQQSGKVRKLPLKVVTFCYHPNIMDDSDFTVLESFLQKNLENMGGYDDLTFSNRRFGRLDWFVNQSYFGFRKIRSIMR
jgi:hypothetical protein